jgi:hypothetical protein
VNFYICILFANFSFISFFFMTSFHIFIFFIFMLYYFYLLDVITFRNLEALICWILYNNFSFYHYNQLICYNSCCILIYIYTVYVFIYYLCIASDDCNGWTTFIIYHSSEFCCLNKSPLEKKKFSKYIETKPQPTDQQEEQNKKRNLKIKK